MIGDGCEGIGKTLCIKSYPIGSIARLGSKVLVLFLEPSQEKHNVLLSCDFVYSRSVRDHIDEVALELSNVRQYIVRGPE